MSGSKRKSAYRKSVVSSYENELPEPNEEAAEIICQVLGTRGANVFEIKIPNEESIELAVLPRKFVNLIWVKRNDFVIIEKGASAGAPLIGTESSSSSSSTSFSTPSSSSSSSSSAKDSKPMYQIKHILSKDQISRLKNLGKWPSVFGANERSRGGYEEDNLIDYTSSSGAYDDGLAEEYEEGNNDEVDFSGATGVKGVDDSC